MVMLAKKVTIDTWNGLEEKIDRLLSLMSKLTTQDDRQNKQFKPKIYQGNRKGQTRDFYHKCNNAQRNIRIGLDQRVEIEEFHLVVGYNVDEIAEIDQYISKTIEMTLEEEIVGGM